MCEWSCWLDGRAAAGALGLTRGVSGEAGG
jgi:hypothetical protein